MCFVAGARVFEMGSNTQEWEYDDIHKKFRGDPEVNRHVILEVEILRLLNYLLYGKLKTSKLNSLPAALFRGYLILPFRSFGQSYSHKYQVDW